MISWNARLALALGSALAGPWAAPGSAPAAEQELVESAEVPDAAPAPVAEEPEVGGPPRRRDPFRPFNLDMRPKNLAPPKTPLEQYEIGSLTLVAVIWNVTDPKAMVEDDAGLGYTVGLGTPIGRNGGVITTIEPDRVIIEEQFVDFYGEKKKKEVELKLKPEGEKRP